MGLRVGAESGLERITCSIAIKRLRLFTQPRPDADLVQRHLLCRLLGVEPTRYAQREFFRVYPPRTFVAGSYYAPKALCDCTRREFRRNILDHPRRFAFENPIDGGCS